jgi:hypothetical protein
MRSRCGSRQTRAAIALAIGLMLAACADAPDGSSGAGEPSPLYASADKWLCRPDLAAADDACLIDLDATVVEASGETRFEPHLVAEDPPFDCFFVYPTINGGPEPNADFDGEYAAERSSVGMHAARLGALCAIHAPLYRQRTLGSSAGPEATELAYGDVREAWQHYLATGDRARGFVLFGHSQGASHLNRLIRDEIDPDPELRARLISALLIGSAVRVPAGADVGGDFANVPACRDPRQTACVVSFASFRATSPPPPDSLFGRPRSGDGEALCTNPAALAGGRAELHPYVASSSPRIFAPGVSAPPIATPWVSLPGLVSGECVVRGEFSYLEITVNADPVDPRADDIVGDLTPEWGLHAVDVPLTTGDLVELVREQAEAWLAEHGDPRA